MGCCEQRGGKWGEGATHAGNEQRTHREHVENTQRTHRQPMLAAEFLCYLCMRLVRTTGVVKTNFLIGNHNFEVYDVGGQVSRQCIAPLVVFSVISRLCSVCLSRCLFPQRRCKCGHLWGMFCECVCVCWGGGSKEEEEEEGTRSSLFSFSVSGICIVCPCVQLKQHQRGKHMSFFPPFFPSVLSSFLSFLSFLPFFPSVLSFFFPHGLVQFSQRVC